jgi:hypothetical protein
VCIRQRGKPKHGSSKGIGEDGQVLTEAGGRVFTCMILLLLACLIIICFPVHRLCTWHGPYAIIVCPPGLVWRPSTRHLTLDKCAVLLVVSVMYRQGKKPGFIALVNALGGTTCLAFLGMVSKKKSVPRVAKAWTCDVPVVCSRGRLALIVHKCWSQSFCGSPCCIRPQQKREICPLTNFNRHPVT